MIEHVPTIVQFSGDFQVFPADVASFVAEGTECKPAPHPEGTADIVSTDLKIKVSLDRGTYILCLFQNNVMKSMPHVKVFVTNSPPASPPPPSPPPPAPHPPPNMLIHVGDNAASSEITAIENTDTIVTFSGNFKVQPGDFAILTLPPSPPPPPRLLTTRWRDQGRIPPCPENIDSLPNNCQTQVDVFLAPGAFNEPNGISYLPSTCQAGFENTPKLPGACWRQDTGFGCCYDPNATPTAASRRLQTVVEAPVADQMCGAPPYPAGSGSIVDETLSFKFNVPVGNYFVCLRKNDHISSFTHVKINVIADTPSNPPPPSPPPPSPAPAFLEM